MTDQDLREMIAQLIASQTETERLFRESKEENDRLFRESKEETERLFRESKEENDRLLRESNEENDQRHREMDRYLKELGKQLGGLGDKFGSFTEGMALPSMTRLLEEQFGLDNIAPRYKVKKKGKTLEIDVFGFSNTDRNVAVAVEIKSHLREEGLQQMLRILHDIPEMMPQHRDKKLYGLIAVVDAPDDLRQRVLDQGIYLADLSDETFTLQVPEDFEPRSFQ